MSDTGMSLVQLTKNLWLVAGFIFRNDMVSPPRPIHTKDYWPAASHDSVEIEILLAINDAG